MFVRWEYQVETPTNTIVFPEGCRDVLVIKPLGGPARVSLTELDHKARPSRAVRETQFVGYRLQPGFETDELEIESLSCSEQEVESYLQSKLPFDTEPLEVIASLVPAEGSISSVAKQAGVSARTLQRQLLKKGLPAPDFWRRLGRATQAACLLRGDANLPSIAYQSGYSDQAHMTGDFRQWFGMTPSQLRANNQCFLDVTQSGLGNWTGEQISIK